MELNESLSAYRFRTILVLVARQNGKTLAKMVVTLWRLYMNNARLIVGTAQDLAQAREVMVEGLITLMEENEYLRKRFDPNNEDSKQRKGIWHRTLADEYFRLDSNRGPRYLIKALNKKAGRGLWNCAELNIDETREQTDFAAWSAVSKIVMAAPDSQIWCMSNAGDRTAVVLSHLRGVAMAGTDESMFLAEWSAPDGCELDDRRAWAQACPSLGYTLTEQALHSAMMTDPPNVFRTEVLCQFVDALNAAVDMSAWSASADPTGAVADHDRRRAGMVVGVSEDGAHVSALVAVVLADGRVRLQVAGTWTSVAQARRALPDLVALFRPKALGWYPNGPGAVLGADMRKLKGEPIKGTGVAEAHMTFAEYVDGRRVLQPGNPTLDIHIASTSKVGTKAWQFDSGVEHTDGAWAAAGAVHLALNIPEPRPLRRKIIVPEDVD